MRIFIPETGNKIWPMGGAAIFSPMALCFPGTGKITCSAGMGSSSGETAPSMRGTGLMARGMALARFSLAIKACMKVRCLKIWSMDTARLSGETIKSISDSGPVIKCLAMEL